MSSQQPVKIQINSLEALERLIGGDSELELQLRQGVCVEFATHWLKPLADNPFFKEALDKLLLNIGEAVDREAKKYIVKRQENSWGKVYYELTGDAKEAIDLEVSRVMEESIRKQIWACAENYFKEMWEKFKVQLNLDELSKKLAEKAVMEVRRQVTAVLKEQ